MRPSPPSPGARELLGRFFEGRLFARLAGLGESLLARELPVLLEPEGDAPEAPVGFWSGAIDLLYFDAGSGEYVVADYKTDRVEAGKARATAERYRSQGGVYARAVQRALGLPEPPRFELWFLFSGRDRRPPAWRGTGASVRQVTAWAAKLRAARGQVPGPGGRCWQRESPGTRLSGGGVRRGRGDVSGRRR